MVVNTEKTDNAEKDIAVEKDVHAEKAIAQTVQKLIDYAFLTDLIGWNDRIWSYNLVLDIIGAEGPAPDEAWVLAEKNSCGGHTGASADTFDLEDTLALLARAAVLNGKEEDTAAGRDCVSMRIMGVLMPKPSDFFQTFQAPYEKNRNRLFLSVKLRCRVCQTRSHCAKYSMDNSHEVERLGNHNQPLQA